jgi:putative ABC transport system permease protein
LIRHLLKLVWHRKRANALIMTEIFFSFLIVFAVVTFAISLWVRWTTPLGFDWHNVWVVDVSVPEPPEDRMHQLATPGVPKEEVDRAKQTAILIDGMMRDLRAFPQIESVAADAMPPYAERQWGTVITSETGQGVFMDADQGTDDFAKTMRVPILKGRWFNREDDASNVIPLIVDTNAAKALFGNADPIGKTLPGAQFSDKKEDFRVVGVIAPYRKMGELSYTTTNVAFLRTSVAHTVPPEANQILIRVRPGTPASFEAELNRSLRPNATGVSFRIQHMDDMRRVALRTRFIPVVILACVALFLISMVALGLTGVLWQTVTRRTREIGVRRALGASGRTVRSQILGEVALLATLAVAVGLVVVVQLPLLGAFTIVRPAEFTTGIFAALAVIYAITLLCGAYPSWLASSIEPADALRYE